MMIERIHREHGYMVRLLALLRHKLNLLKSERPVNYGVLRELVDYLANHAEKVHHPKEDILYHYYLEHYGHNQQIDNLELEHKTLSEKSHAFLDMVEMVLQDAVIPQDIFIEHLQAFLDAQKKHLEIEERNVFPHLIEKFTVKDWQAVEEQWSVCEDDPVFGATIAEQYQQLADRVHQTEHECS
ncbi:hemerythrin domain-containing protein [Vibrio sinaloensis]|uniref:hemerythrin domain-containing protein n=1 Tax=Photobacterium sp. (strain ATCC 43367) TaxID=379097 RepID=UPI00204928C4|nr:hemerythrin domain-containing protein [Vibrio sinaloensis]UPQ88491.1 hemerythrin domain-containing protein [Vibrio sinaloensis]